jgi:hypothetical protein
MDATGVTPLPPVTRRDLSAFASTGPKRPAGPKASIIAPGASVACRWPDIRPPGFRFTVIDTVSPTAAEEESE